VRGETGRTWIGAAIAVAAVARVAWLWAKPFWRDEAWVALLAGQPLDTLFRDPRPVPLGFLALVKVTGALPMLPAELSLRLVPLAAGLLVLPLLAMLARRLGASECTAAAAVWLAAGLPALVYYSRELKPYGLDLLLGVLLPWLALDRAEPRSEAPPARRRLAAAGLIACAVLTPWLTFGGVFVTGPTLAWLVWRRRRDTVAWAALGAFVLSLGAAYWTVLALQADVPRLRETWRDELGVEARTLPALAWRFFAVSWPYLFPGVWPIAALLALAGLATWPRRHRALVAGLLLGPAAAVIAAAAMGRYVMGQGRFLLFTAPPCLLMAAAGLVHLAVVAGRWMRRSNPERAGVLVAAAAGLVWAGQAVALRLLPYRNDIDRYFLYDVLHDVEPIIEEAARRRTPDAPVMVSRYAGDPFLFYERGRLPGAVVCTRRTCPDAGVALQGWLRTVPDRGLLIVLEEEREAGLRTAAQLEGFEVRTVAKSRGVRLWAVKRARAR
jgi:hypothetical protein